MEPRIYLRPGLGDEHGFALIVAMLVIVALTMMGMAAITTTGMENRISSSYQKAKVAYEASDACLQGLYAQLSDADFNMLLNPADLSGTVNFPGVGGGYLASYRAPVYDDPAYVSHPNFNGDSIDTRFGVPRHPNPLTRPGPLVPGMNIARRGSYSESGGWDYRIWEVQCEGWVENPNHPGDINWASSYYSFVAGLGRLEQGFTASAGATGH